MDLPSHIEGVLFFKAEPLSIATLAHLTESSLEEVQEALAILDTRLQDHGITLVTEGSLVQLMTKTALAGTIEKIRREELKRDIGKAGAETLAIIAYHESVSRAEIEYIRGVNSTFILRNLLIRGLIERIPHPEDQRSFAYRPTLALYAHLGVTKKEELPQYHEMKEAIATYKEGHKNASAQEETV